MLRSFKYERTVSCSIYFISSFPVRTFEYYDHNTNIGYHLNYDRATAKWAHEKTMFVPLSSFLDGADHGESLNETFVKPPQISKPSSYPPNNQKYFWLIANKPPFIIGLLWGCGCKVFSSLSKGNCTTKALDSKATFTEPDVITLMVRIPNRKDFMSLKDIL
ncbi:hypothetical protein FF38_10181 [Lucilia cuprina]|uniref:Uncharacterized protein n=1 Tax=Lucilia cuprina TaxID=7375 RepID=A0A0L0CR21_LUCCU|nr:hypothetical protein FF38_10181 [Lucilia cuprina]